MTKKTNIIVRIQIDGHSSDRKFERSFYVSKQNIQIYLILYRIKISIFRLKQRLNPRKEYF